MAAYQSMSRPAAGGARLQPHCGLRSDKTLPEAQRDAEDGNGREDGQRRVQFLRAYGRGAEAEAKACMARRSAAA